MGGRSSGLALALTLPGQFLGCVCWFSLVVGSVINSEGVLWILNRVERPLPLLPQACKPHSLGINLYIASALPCGVPTSCLFVLAHPFRASSKFGRVLPTLPLLILLTASTSLLALPPTTTTIVSSSSKYCLSSDILSSIFSMMWVHKYPHFDDATDKL